MKHIFSLPTLIFLFLNACLLLGIAYLWYPRISDVRGDAIVFTVQEGRLEASTHRASTFGEDWRREETVAVEEVANEEKSAEQDPGYGLQVIPPVTLDGIPSEGGTSSTSEIIEDSATSETLPSKINLAVPFTSQAPEGNWDQPWQDACEEAAILMLDAYYKEYNLSPLFSKDELLKMVDWQTEKGWGYSIPMGGVAKVTEWYMGESFHYTILEDPTVEQLKQSLAAGHPVLVVAYGKALGNPFFSGDGPVYHALIIRGYTENGFITNDPGTKHGEGFVYDFDTLMNSIHDWNGGDVPNGKSVVLVVDR